LAHTSRPRAAPVCGWKTARYTKSSRKWGENAEESALAYKDEILGAGGIAFLLKRYRAFEAPEKPVATESNLEMQNE